LLEAQGSVALLTMFDRTDVSELTKTPDFCPVDQNCCDGENQQKRKPFVFLCSRNGCFPVTKAKKKNEGEKD
jgi:hypothetical protein